MTESLRERCIEAAMAEYDFEFGHDWTPKDMATRSFDAVLDVLEESAEEIPVTVAQHAWRCPNCGGDHGDAGCGEPLPVLWRAFTMDNLLSVLRAE